MEKTIVEHGCLVKYLEMKKHCPLDSSKPSGHLERETSLSTELEVFGGALVTVSGALVKVWGSLVNVSGALVKVWAGFLVVTLLSGGLVVVTRLSGCLPTGSRV